MARPNKQGLDYFPLDVHLDDKIKFIKARFKWEGFGIMIGVFQHIYSQGYWCSWNADDAFLYSDDNKIELDLLNNIIEESLKRKLFCIKLYEKYKILTSQGIQKRYIEIVKRRRNVDIMKEYVLIGGSWGQLDVSNMSTTCKQGASKSTQSKGNRKEIESKEKVKNKYLEDSEEFRVANFLYQNILKNKPDFLKPNFQTWAKHADLMLRVDKRSLTTAKKLIVWVQNDDFENTRVLSISKLRKRFDSLEMTMKNAKIPKKPSYQPPKRERTLAELKAAATYHDDGRITLPE